MYNLSLFTSSKGYTVHVTPNTSKTTFNAFFMKTFSFIHSLPKSARVPLLDNLIKRSVDVIPRFACQIHNSLIIDYFFLVSLTSYTL